MQDLDDAEVEELRAAVDGELGSGMYDKAGKHILKAGVEIAAAVAAFKTMGDEESTDSAPTE